MTASSSAHPDLWHRYGTSRRTDDENRGVAGRFHWDWYQRAGPGAELLGNVAGRTVVDLGSGNGRLAAHVAWTLAPRRVIGVDASPAATERAHARYGHVPRLHPVHADAAACLQRHPASIDTAYSVFGAVDFTDPRILLPATAQALRPGGLLVISTLGHYRDGSPPEPDVRPVRIPVRTADGATATLARWVLGVPVWERQLTRAGLAVESVNTLRDPGGGCGPPMDTVILSARRPARPAQL
ncbi:class I SAM-dependent methyltransferase [Streptomyces sp. NPDC050560]|uniref:class I SAM-dependent methyltransferase n=1 Tax=Streptomyces sp. NPDC050560 TaxID=3365630 RepID=UPI0037A928D0